MIGALKHKWKNTPESVKASAAYVVCSIIQKGISFFTIPIFTRLLTTEQYGQYTIYSSWTGILTIFLTLNLSYGSFETAMIKYENRRSEYVSSIQGIYLLLSLIFITIYLPFRNLWNVLFELPTPLVLLMISEIIFSTSTQLWMGKSRFEYKYKGVVILSLLISFLSPIIAYALVSTVEEKGYARIIGYAFISIIVGLIIFTINVSKGKRIFNKEFWEYAFKFNLPLLAYYISQVIFNQSDRIMISHMIGKSDAAIYGIAYNLAMVMTFVLNAINGSYVPWLYKKIKDNKCEDNKSVSSSLVVIIGVMILFVIWFTPEILEIFAGSSYSNASRVVAPVAISLLLLFYCQLFINVEFYFEEKKLLIWGSLGAATLNIILNYLLIPVWGYVSAGYTTLISYIVFAFSNCYTMKLCLKKKKIACNLFNYRFLVAFFVLFFITSFIGVAMYNHLYLRLTISCITIIVLFMFRKKMINTIRVIKEK